MKKLQSDITNMSLSLLFISVAVAALLAWVNAVTQGPIEEINKQTVAEGVKKVLLGDSDIAYHVEGPIEKDGFEFYRAYSSPDSILLGTAVKSTDGNAFSGDLVVLVGFNPEGDILGYEILEHAETPGLGAQASTWFKQKNDTIVSDQSPVATAFFGAAGKQGNHNIIGMNPGKDNLTVSKDGGDIDAISASTITSRAFLRSVVNAYNALYGDRTVMDGTTSATVQQ